MPVSYHKPLLLKSFYTYTLSLLSSLILAFAMNMCIYSMLLSKYGPFIQVKSEAYRRISRLQLSKEQPLEMSVITIIRAAYQ